jgi:hypothetical protein
MTVNAFTNGTTTGSLTTTSSTAINALSFPYVTLRIPELDGNNYGSDNSLDNAFGIVQYDANWNTDNNLTDGRGFLAMIPKFLKCQKSYHPTPLSTLTKLTFQIQRPTGGFLSDISDSFRVCSVCTSVLFNPVTTSSKYSGTNLTEATHIFFVEPIDNTKENIIAIEGQAIGRAVRLGQKQKTEIIRILCKNTIEDEIYNAKYI